MKKILVIAAHPDDEFLGCGATLLSLKKKSFKIKTLFLADGESSRLVKKKKINKLIQDREKQARNLAKKCDFLPPIFYRFPDNKLDTVSFLEIIKSIEKEIIKFKPEIIFTHFESDLNIDHQLVSRAVITATRPFSKTFVNKIYCFETPSSTEFNFTRKPKKLFNPNLFIDVSNFINHKIKLLKIYKNEIRSWPHPRSLKSIKNLAAYRGSQIGVKFAEAFVVLREIR